MDEGYADYITPPGYTARSTVKPGRYAEPKPPRCALYYHYDEDDHLLYIGISEWPPKRDIGHTSYSEWVKYAVRMEAVWLNSRKLALEAEARDIAEKNPVFNRQGAEAGRTERVTAYLAQRTRPAPGDVAQAIADEESASLSALRARGRIEWNEKQRRLSRIRARVKDGSARQIRLQAGWTLAQVAAKLGVVESTVSRWEEGKRPPKDMLALGWDELLDDLRQIPTAHNPSKSE